MSKGIPIVKIRKSDNHLIFSIWFIPGPNFCQSCKSLTKGLTVSTWLHTSVLKYREKFNYRDGVQCMFSCSDPTDHGRMEIDQGLAPRATMVGHATTAPFEHGGMAKQRSWHQTVVNSYNNPTRWQAVPLTELSVSGIFSQAGAKSFLGALLLAIRATCTPWHKPGFWKEKEKLECTATHGKRYLSYLQTGI